MMILGIFASVLVGIRFAIDSAEPVIARIDITTINFFIITPFAKKQLA
jgi:hypothetical protein